MIRQMLCSCAVLCTLVSSAAASDPVRVLRGYADGPDGQIHYRIAGATRDRPPLLCLHPSPLTSVVYGAWLGEMGRDRLAVAPDTPGYGGSDLPAKPPEISDFAAAMVRLLDELELKQVDVMGYHTGSLTAAEMAHRYPDRVRRIVMISAPIFTAKELADYRAGLASQPTTLPETLKRNLAALERAPMGMFTDLPTEQHYWDISVDRLRSYRTSTWGHRAAFNYDLAAVLPTIDQPILVLNPEDDLWQHSKRAAPHLKNGRIHDLPGWTHGALDGHTAEMAALVRTFLDKP